MQHGAQQHGGSAANASSVTFTAAVEGWTQDSFVFASVANKHHHVHACMIIMRVLMLLFREEVSLVNRLQTVNFTGPFGLEAVSTGGRFNW